MAARARLVAANWKMNGTRADNARWLDVFGKRPPACDCVICPPYVYLDQVLAGVRAGAADVGAQDVSDRAPGAWTGEVAAEMLADAGVAWVIVGPFRAARGLRRDR